MVFNGASWPSFGLDEGFVDRARPLQADVTAKVGKRSFESYACPAQTSSAATTVGAVWLLAGNGGEVAGVPR
jgi:hypothetical protein